MKIDKPVKRTHKNIQLDDYEVSQLIVFNELIQESIEYETITKTVKKKSFTKAEAQRLKLIDSEGKLILNLPEPIDFEIESIKVSKNVSDYNKFKKAKKKYIKQLEEKYK